ncbi:MAG: hypothetical protein ACRDAM_04000, partial [Casimicrobium sp.]
TPARVDGAPTLGSAGGVAATNQDGVPTITNILVADGQIAGGYLFSKRRPMNTNTVDLRVTVTPTSAVLRANTDASLLVNVENLGTATAQTASVRFTLPSFAAMNVGAPSGTTFDVIASTWYLSDLAAGQRRQLRVTLSALSSVVAPATANFEATAQSASNDTNLPNNTASAEIRLLTAPACALSTTLTIEPLVLIRYLQGLRGLDLVTGVYSVAQATQALAEVLAQNLSANLDAYDFDGDGTVTAEVDGVIYARYALGLRGQTLIEGITIPANTNLNAVTNRLEACQ